MKLPTIKVYKGSKSVLINKSDYDAWKADGWKSSSDRQKESKAKKAVKDADTKD